MAPVGGRRRPTVERGAACRRIEVDLGHHVAMSVVRRATEPARVPVRRVVSHYRTFFEELIHAVKNEIVERLDRIDDRLDEFEEVVERRHDTLADQMTVQAAALRAMETEIERLQDLARAAEPEAGKAPEGEAAVVADGGPKL